MRDWHSDRRGSPSVWLGGWVLGSALQLQQSTLWSWEAYAVGSVVLAAMVALWALAARQNRILQQPRQPPAGWSAWWITLLLAAALGFGVTGWRASDFARTTLNPALEGQDIIITGRVDAMPQRGDDAVRFRFMPESARSSGQEGVAVSLPPRLLLGWYAGFGPRASVEPGNAVDPDGSALALQRQPQPLRAGERWELTVRLRAPHGNSNPHGFDYELWLWEQGIQATGYVRAGQKDQPPRRLSSSWERPTERLRQSVREAIERQIQDRRWAGVVAALVVGDQSAIDRSDWDIFRVTGVAHLMSISGLHITMFAWIAALLTSALWRRSARWTPRLCLAVPAATAGALGGLALAVLYSLFSGWGVPAQRTIWMLAAVVVLRVSGRQWPPSNTWLLAMAVVVAGDPWALMQAGFWLSFVAVGILFLTDSATKTPDSTGDQTGTGLLHLAPVSWSPGSWTLYRGWIRSVGLRVAAGMREQWVVTLALTPLSLLLFNEASVVGLLANAVAIPWVTLVVTPVALAGVVWSPLWDVAAGMLGLLIPLLEQLARWSFASISVPAAPLWAAVAGVLGGALLAIRLPVRWRLLGVPLLLPVLLWQRPGVPIGQFELLAADVGQGNAVLVRTAGHTLLYDAGPRYGTESNAGQRVLVPLLRALGDRVDMVMLSHRDADHTGGAAAVLGMQPKAALLSSIEDAHELQTVRPSTRCAAGQHWLWDGVSFDVLHPDASDYGEGGRVGKANTVSCVLRISGGGQTALLAGDIEWQQERRLVSQLAAATPSSAETDDGGAGVHGLKADVLLVPHHGSRTSSSEAFLDAVQPRIALAQAGYRNRFNHPVPLVVARYQGRGIALVQTSQCGAATWRSTAPDQVQCERQSRARYWHHGLLAQP